MSAGLILIAASLEQLDGLDRANAPGERAGSPPPQQDPVTWLVTAGPLTPEWITGGRPTVAVRVTQHPVAAGLCLASGLPLVSTSANRRGKPPARSALGARLRFRPSPRPGGGRSNRGSGRAHGDPGGGLGPGHPGRAETPRCGRSVSRICRYYVDITDNFFRASSLC